MSVSPVPRSEPRRPEAASSPSAGEADRFGTINPSRVAIESMLGPFPRPPEGTADFVASVTEAVAPGAGVGRAMAQPAYLLQTLVGAGGHGEVWESVQTSIGRRVAVKRLRPDLIRRAAPDTAVLSSLEVMFRQEALITALLEHPNIVPVYDLGYDDHGHPQLAMKLVRGASWRGLLARDRDVMTPAAFLARHIPVLIDVAQATAFAHSRGIVHRDIKPGQVMVGEFGEVLLMDWGLALVYDAKRLPELTVLAETLPSPENSNGPAGTTVLMAPEQTEPMARRVGPWTDVYLLGATLYYLLTGVYPHEADTQAETQRRARLGIYTPVHRAAPDREHPEELVRLADECLSAEPAQRPQRAEAVVRALTDWLTGNTRRAESEQLVAQARSCLAGSDYAAYAEGTALLDRARLLWPENPSVAPLTEQAAEGHGRLALRQGDLALARTQARRMTGAIARERLLREVHAAEIRQQRRERQRRGALAVAAALGAVLFAATALFLVREKGLRAVAEAERDRAKRAASAEAEARTQAIAQRDLADAARKDSDELINFMINDLRNSVAPFDPDLKSLGDIARRAEAYHRHLMETGATDAIRLGAAESLAKLGRIYSRQGNLEAARAATSDAVRWIRREMPKGGWSSYWANSLAEALLEVSLVNSFQAQLPDSLARAREAEELVNCPGPPDQEFRRAGILLLAISKQGEVLSRLGRRAEAVALLDRSVALARERLELFPEAPSVRHDHTIELLRYADVMRARGDAIGSLPYYEEILRERQRLAEEFPDNAAYWRDLNVAHDRMAFCMERLGRLDEAYRHLLEGEQAIEIWASLEPSSLLVQRDLAVRANQLGQLLFRKGDLEGSLAHLLRARELRVELVRRDPSNRDIQRGLGTTHELLAGSYRSLGRREEAIAEAREAMRVRRALLALNPDSMEERGLLATTAYNLLLTEQDMGFVGEALATGEECLAAIRTLLAQDPNNIHILRGMEAAGTRMALLHEEFGQWDAALAIVGELDPWMLRLARLPAQESAYFSVASNAIMRTRVLLAAGRPEEAVASAQQARSLAIRIAAEVPEAATEAPDLLETVPQFLGGLALLRLGREAEGIAALESAARHRSYFAEEPQYAGHGAAEFAARPGLRDHLLDLWQREWADCPPGAP